MNYKQILDDVLEIEQSITIIRGFSDIIIEYPTPIERKIFKDLNKDSFWIVMGRGNEEMIVESMSDVACDVDKEGEYEFKAVLKWVPGDYDEYGCTMRDYLELEYIEFNFIQTFQQRERQEKLDLILCKEIDDLFNF
jgi:hypothetical protein